MLLLALKEGNTVYQAEVAPLSDLSVDGKLDLLGLISPFLEQSHTENSLMELLEFCTPYPSLRFVVYALIQKLRAHNNIWADTPFTRKESALKINGLVWMNDIESMSEEAENKVNQGFTCIKFKVGALDFDAECRMLEAFRKKTRPLTLKSDWMPMVLFIQTRHYRC